MRHKYYIYERMYRANGSKHEVLKRILKFIIYNQKIKQTERILAMQLLHRLNLKSTISSFCLVSSRYRGVNNVWKLNRVQLKTFIEAGYLWGVKVQSW